MYSTAYISGAAWNDTRWKRPDFDKMANAARGELDEGKRKRIYRDMGLMMRDEGGLIVPYFNQFVDATGKVIEGWVDNPAWEFSNGRALIECWHQA
jgi:peptide/nickel transport system substrate-binding protein